MAGRKGRAVIEKLLVSEDECIVNNMCSGLWYGIDQTVSEAAGRGFRMQIESGLEQERPAATLAGLLLTIIIPIKNEGQFSFSSHNLYSRQPEILRIPVRGI